MSTSSSVPQLLTLRDAAKALSCGYSTLCRLLKQKALPYVTVGKDRRILVDDLRRYIEAHRSQR
jgi:excisionase family DNA binding protein